MKESAQAQHEVDKANFAATKAESKAQREEAKAMGDPNRRKAVMQAQRDEQIAAAKERTAAAQKHIEAAKKDGCILLKKRGRQPRFQAYLEHLGETVKTHQVNYVRGMHCATHLFDTFNTGKGTDR